MGNGSDEVMQEVDRRARACAARAREAGASGMAGHREEWTALVNAVRALDPKYAFDTEGRPSAIAAVRQALPSIERELLDAILEDHACEVAALYEAAARLALALTGNATG